MTTRLQVRKDTAANWTSNNPTLYAGEIGFETDTDYFKIGDGSTAWTSLDYAAKGASLFSATTITATAGAGYQNMVVQTTGTAATYTLPAAVQKTGAKFKVTVVGGGGGGAASTTTAGSVGSGGGGGGVTVAFLTFVAGQTTATYTVGAAGTAGATTPADGTAGGTSNFIYNSVTYQATGGGFGTGQGVASSAGGAGGVGTVGTLNLTGEAGMSGGTMAATSNYLGEGGASAMGFGFGGRMPATAAGAVGNPGTGYGSGGSGGRSGTAATARAGGAGTAGLVIIEY